MWFGDSNLSESSSLPSVAWHHACLATSLLFQSRIFSNSMAVTFQVVTTTVYRRQSHVEADRDRNVHCRSRLEPAAHQQCLLPSVCLLFIHSPVVLIISETFQQWTVVLCVACCTENASTDWNDLFCSVFVQLQPYLWYYHQLFCTGHLHVISIIFTTSLMWHNVHVLRV